MTTCQKQPEAAKPLEAKECLKALSYGLRSSNLLIDDDNLADYYLLWFGLESEWQPQTPTERHYLEQMSTSQWLLGRTARTEQSIYAAGLRIDVRCALLDQVARQRARLERSFTSALRELKLLQKERQARLQQQSAQAPKTAPDARPAPKPAGPTAPPPAYVISEGARNHPVVSTCTAPDSR